MNFLFREGNPIKGNPDKADKNWRAVSRALASAAHVGKYATVEGVVAKAFTSKSGVECR